ncbi:PREDICTED: disintegrin and metalloproteinase domain-containing protein 32-like [Chaetura pelagica]|uniref:disintegrin and metalloproteinase domain-containing protein 32-like n=1 Tax=Chaetura pelagica TaxID=8897 RepID=UPI000523240B|nr:PREDICTED: disintegrin and metalloproteinase domain-containing protein 32-like [Chaetura pelagica]
MVLQVTVPQKLLSKGAGETDTVSYGLRIEGKPYTIHLQQQYFLPDDFRIYTYDEEGSLHSHWPRVKAGCHYQGHIAGFPSSAVTLSTCSGLRGLLQFENVSYGIEPRASSPAFEHFVYRVSEKQVAGSLLANGPTARGLGDLVPEEVAKKAPGAEQYNYLGADEEVVTQTMFEVFSLLSSMFRSLNLTVTLSSMEVWMDKGTFRTTGDGEEVLGRLLKWRQTSPVLQPHEVPYLLLPFKPKNALCRPAADLHCDLPEFCNGSSASCPPDLYVQDGHNCLCVGQMLHSPVYLQRRSELHRGIMLCKLPGKFKPKNALCRPAADLHCDLPEFCNGSSASCPPDLYVQDGHNCEHSSGYCYQGRCRSPDLQCRQLCGKGSRNAPLICYQEVNMQGDRFGHCGRHPSRGYQRCSWESVGCGKLVCSYPGAVPFTKAKVAVIYVRVADHLCLSFDFMQGPKVQDPLLMKDGTKCGHEMVCMNGTCHPHSILNYDCNVQKKCHGHGVCNNKKNCHCLPGWSPPSCETRGSSVGGSINSPPDADDVTEQSLLVVLKNSLLLSFSSVFLILLCGGGAVAKWSWLKKYCARRDSQAESSEEGGNVRETELESDRESSLELQKAQKPQNKP